MKILGIDYGRAKIGLAVAEGPSTGSGLAQPLSVLRVNSEEDALGKVVQVVQVEQVEKVVVGISEGEMGKEQERFAQALAEKLEIPVETWDETLSTQEAQQRAIDAGIPQGRRRKLEDAFAAAVVLQSYLDQHGSNTKDS